MSTALLGAASRALLKVRDDKLRRCRWCGAWAYDREPCTACTWPAEDEQR